MGEALAALPKLLQPGGALSGLLPGYECRPEQQAMLQAVCEAFARDGVLLVEAGTGVGKSLAYGLPAAAFARAARCRVVLSTGTINLQEQLVGKDLPLVDRLLGGGLSWTLVKGRANYLCRRRLEERLRQRLLFSPDERGAALEALADWAERTADGSRSDLERPPPDALWETVCSDPDACLQRRCPRRDDCFFARARRAAEEADLLVVNHHLLFADLAVRRRLAEPAARAVLPIFERLVLDEGHELEDAASEFFGTRLTRRGVARGLGRLAGGRGALLAAVNAEVAALSGADNGAPLVERVRQARAAFEQAFELLPELVGGAAAGERLRLDPGVYGRDSWTAVRESFRQAAGIADTLSEGLYRQLERLESLGESDSLAAELRASARRAGELAEAARLLVDEREDGQVRWIEYDRSGAAGRLCAAPLSVAGVLGDALGALRTAVVTSATLAVAGSLDYLQQRLGVERVAPERRVGLQLASPYDYPRQALLLLPTDGPLPTESGFEGWLVALTERAIAISGGRALVLFTSRSLMERSFERLRDGLEAAGFEPLCQGHSPRDRLLRRFRDNPASVLFGTDSFWQGVDVVGEALRLVLIARLPFDVPDEPLVQARLDQIARQGGRPFADYSLPRAVLKLKQGFGRLIRSGADWGAVWILDRRLVHRPYGRRFLDSLPGAEFRSGPEADLFSRMEAFFRERLGT